MIDLVFPQPEFRMRIWQDQRQIFDIIRKKWVALQPEEWVRQNLIHWLIRHHKIEASFIAVEKTIRIQGNSYRFDLLIYDKEHLPWMIIECKAPHISLDDKSLMQVLTYQQMLPVKYWMI
ncbi:MAG: hypothetical protein RLZZ172_2086, partial [Bacteroidota bacterium]